MADATDSRGDVTALLRSTAGGQRDNVDEIFQLVYDELRQLAHRQLSGQWGQYTLDTTSLVHEAYMKLVDATSISAEHRAYFFGAAARAMRQVLVDAARRRNRLKRGGGQENLPFDETTMAASDFAAQLIVMDESLERLAADYPRQAEVVECRFFGGLSTDETAAVLSVSRRTVMRDWILARAWLHRDLSGQPCRSADDGDRPGTSD